MNIQNLVLDINKKCNQLVTANVGEVNSRLLKISVIDNGVPMDLTGITVYLYAKKADGTKVFNIVKVEDAKQGIVSAEITSQVLAIEGFVKLTLLLTKDRARLASKIFTLKVDETIVDDEALESSNEFKALDLALDKVDGWNGYFEETSGKLEEKYTERLNQVNSQLAHNTNEIINLKQLKINVKDYGAKGDGITDDTEAFKKACESLADNSILFIPNGTYIVGKQETTDTTYLKGFDIINISNKTGVKIEGNGATLKIKDGMKFGAFNPDTGEVYDPKLPCWDYGYAAQTGTIIQLTNCKHIIIENLCLDGNIENLIIGGRWGDTGRQCRGNGLRLYNCSEVQMNNVVSENFPLDGMSIVYQNLTEESAPINIIVNNCRFRYNARQGVSVVGGKHVVFNNCEFSHTGQKVFASSPGAGVDLEAENSVVLDTYFNSCFFLNNNSAGLLADSGIVSNCHVNDSTIWGGVKYALYIKKNNFTFTNCNIFGSVILWGNNAVFNNCRIEDREHSQYGYYNPGYMCDFNGAHSLKMINCIVQYNHNKGLYIAGLEKNALLKDTRIINNSNGVKAGGVASVIRSTVLDNVTFEDTFTNEYTSAPYYDVSSVTVLDNVKIGTKTRWGSPTSVVVDTFLAKTSTASVFQGIKLQCENSAETRPIHKVRKTVPTSGVYNRGDVIFNANASAGGYIGWVCITSGDFATDTKPAFKAFGAINS